MTKANKILSYLKENSMISGALNLSQETEKTELDECLELIEELDLGYDCLKSNYSDKIMVDTVSDFLESIEDSEVEEYIGDLIESMDSLDEAKSALVKPLPYHNMFGRPVGNSYSAIMRGRKKGGNADVSVLQLGNDKFMDKDNKHFAKVRTEMLSQKDPVDALERLFRALTNIEINFKKRKPAISNRAVAVKRFLKSLALPDKYYKAKEKQNKK